MLKLTILWPHPPSSLFIGLRFILANTEELHERIEALQERITQLECGLSSLHAQSPNAHEVHPLLTDELMNIKTPIGAEIVGSANPRSMQRSRDRERERDANSGGEHGDEEGFEPTGSGSGATNGNGAPNGSAPAMKQEEGEISESFGTLQLGEGSAHSQFFGIAAGAHYLLGVSSNVIVLVLILAPGTEICYS